MYKLLISFYLLFFYTTHASQFKIEDLMELSQIGNIQKGYKSYPYLSVFGKDVNFDGELIQKFRLKNGVDVEISLNNLKNFITFYNLTEKDKATFNSFNFLLGLEFEEFTFPKQIANDSNTLLTLKMRKMYGCICNDKFESYSSFITLAFLYPNEQVCIKDNHYKICVDQSSITQNEFLKKLALREDISLFSFSSHGKAIFRYMSPENTGNKYGLFLRTLNHHMNDLGQEEFIGSFTIKQVFKEF